MYRKREELPHIVFGQRQGVLDAVQDMAERAHGPAHEQPRDMAVGKFVFIRYIIIIFLKHNRHLVIKKADLVP